MFCGKVFNKTGGGGGGSTGGLSNYECKDNTACKDIDTSKAIPVASAKTAADCAKACDKTTNCRTFQFEGGSALKCTVLKYRTRSVYFVLPVTPTSYCCKAPK